VIVVLHQNVAVQGAAVFFLGVFEVCFELVVIRFCRKDPFAFVSPAGHMVECSLVFDPKGSCHRKSLPMGRLMPLFPPCVKCQRAVAQITFQHKLSMEYALKTISISNYLLDHI